MAIDNQFRIGELISSGSRAIVSKDSITGNHTFTMGSKEVINTPYEHIKGERDGELIGRIEKPKYDESELKKAVDTDVDELIGPPKKEKPAVVPRPVYEDMRNQFLTASAELAIANERIQDLESEVETLKSEIATLLIQVDALSLQTAAAQNEAQTTNDRYTLLLQDFSSAIVKSTKEGIERVSLKAQTEGLIAQKESLREQLKSLNLIVGQLESQLSGAAAESAAAASGLTPGSDNEFFYGVDSDEQQTGYDLKWTTSKKNKKASGKSGALTIQNLRDDSASITKVEIIARQSIDSSAVKQIIGFTDTNNPASSNDVNIEVGQKESLTLYFNKDLGGYKKPAPSGGTTGARDYNGNWSIKVTYSDGSTAESNSLSWRLRKNKG